MSTEVESLNKAVHSRSRFALPFEVLQVLFDWLRCCREWAEMEIPALVPLEELQNAGSSHEDRARTSVTKYYLHAFKVVRVHWWRLADWTLSAKHLRTMRRSCTTFQSLPKSLVLYILLGHGYLEVHDFTDGTPSGFVTRQKGTDPALPEEPRFSGWLTNGITGTGIIGFFSLRRIWDIPGRSQVGCTPRHLSPIMDRRFLLETGSKSLTFSGRTSDSTSGPG